MFNSIGRNEMIVILANVIFLMIAQTIFFQYLASNQYETVLACKLATIKDFVGKNPGLSAKLNEIKKKKIIELEKNATLQQEQREKINSALTWRYCGIPVIIALIALWFVIFFMSTKDDDSVASIYITLVYITLVYITLVYSTQLLFFLLIIQQYEFVGDQYIISTFMSKLLE
jgi:membrane glycosyltransferase